MPDRRTLNVEFVREPGTRRRGSETDVHGFGYLNVIGNIKSAVKATQNARTFHASINTPIPEPKRIIQLVFSLLSIR
jgi:hypothetical protein